MQAGNLILSRKPGQAILIGNDIAIEVVKVNGNRVSVAIVAPKELRVMRREVLEREQREDAA